MHFMVGHQFKLLVKTVHMVAACAWLGAGLAVLVLLKNGSQTNNGDELFALNHTITSIDDLLIKPAAALSLGSGVLLCLISQWGVAKYRWIVFKWVATFAAILFGSLYLEPLMKELAMYSDMFRDEAMQNSTYRFVFHVGVVTGLLQTAVLFLLLFVSVLKPSLGTAPSKEPARRFVSLDFTKAIRHIYGLKAYTGRH